MSDGEVSVPFRHWRGANRCCVAFREVRPVTQLSDARTVSGWGSTKPIGPLLKSRAAMAGTALGVEHPWPWSKYLSVDIS